MCVTCVLCNAEAAGVVGEKHPMVEWNSEMKVANAPVSYGLFGLAHKDSPLPTGQELVRAVAEAGYEGIDLGALGLLGRDEELTALLRNHGLGLAGGWIDLPFGSGTDEEFKNALKHAELMMPQFVAGAKATDLPAPKPTLADSGDTVRKQHPGGGPSWELDEAGWDRFGSRLAEAAQMVRSYGFEPTFHHHASTYVETPAEIDRFLSVGDVDLTFDTGHLLIGGGDPVADLQRWLPRINHVHIKDADLNILKDAMGSADPVRDVWEKRVFVPLGQGDLDVEQIMDLLMSANLDGWLVVEQDVVIFTEEDVQRAKAEQKSNREALRKWL